MADPQITFYEYAACDSCRKAKAWLKGRRIEFHSVPIVDKPPSPAQLNRFIAMSGSPARAFINTSGQSYRALIADRGRDAVQALDDKAIIALFAKDGKLIKRPLLITKENVVVGWNAARYEEIFPSAR